MDALVPPVLVLVFSLTSTYANLNTWKFCVCYSWMILLLYKRSNLQTLTFLHYFSLLTNKQIFMEFAYLKVCFTIQDIREKGIHCFVLLHCEFCKCQLTMYIAQPRRSHTQEQRCWRKFPPLGKKLWSHCGLYLTLSQTQGRKWKNYTFK